MLNTGKTIVLIYQCLFANVEGMIMIIIII